MGQPVNLPAWLVTLLVGLGVTLTGANVKTAYDAGEMATSLHNLSQAFEKMDKRIERIERQLDESGNRLTALEEWKKATEAATAKMPAHDPWNRYSLPRAR